MVTGVGWFLGGTLVPVFGLLGAGLLIAALQWLILIQRINSAWRWFIFSSAGWMAGWILSLFLVPEDLFVFNGLLIGLATGFAQWIILRSEVSFSEWWIALNGIGWFAGFVLFPGVLSTGIIAGLITGSGLIVLQNYPVSEDTIRA